MNTSRGETDPADLSELWIEMDWNGKVKAKIDLVVPDAVEAVHCSPTFDPGAP
jgi:hypothetical protein